MSKTIMTDKQLIVPLSRKARPITDDMRTMCDDINRVEPLPVLVSRDWVRKMARELDRSLMAAIYGFSW
jgi:hypothetical protein